MYRLEELVQLSKSGKIDTMADGFSFYMAQVPDGTLVYYQMKKHLDILVLFINVYIVFRTLEFALSEREQNRIVTIVCKA